MIYKKIHVEPELKREIISHITCDICGSKGSGMDDGVSDFAQYHDEKVEVGCFITTGGYDCDGMGGEKTIKYCNVCPTCFEEKVMPCLEKLGVKFSEETTEW